MMHRALAGDGRDAVIAVAGQAAERLFGLPETREPDALALAGGADRLRTARQIATRILREHQGTVSRLADMLLARGELGADEIGAMLRHVGISHRGPWDLGLAARCAPG